MPIASLFRSVARPLCLVCTLLTAATTTVLAQTNTPSAADGFDPNVDGNVYALATQPDGKVIIAGGFATLRPNNTSGASRNNLARVNSDGSLDLAFDPNANGPVRALVLQPDGKILLAGDFTALRPNGAATATTRNRLARLNADGTLDAAFNPNVGGGFTPQVYALLLQPDGKIVLGGGFTTVGTTTRNRLARLNPDGSLDATFNPNANNVVFALAFHVNNKIVVAGGFTSLQANGATSATTRNRIARLNADGTPDSEFDPNLDNRATALAVQRDGKIILGGDFTTLQPTGTDTPITHIHIARLNVDGSLDTGFNSNASANVGALAVAPDGRVLAGGSFTAVWSVGAPVVGRNYLARFNPDGTVDVDFSASVNQVVDAFAFQADGQLVIGGLFTGLLPRGAAGSVVRNRIARLNPNGALDVTLNLDAAGRPLVEAVQKDGKLLLGGSFTSVGGVTHNHLVRLNTDGTVDTTFNPDLNGLVLTMVVQPADQKIVIGGTFTTIGGEPRNFIARLNPSGTIDSEFNPNANGLVGVVALQSDGKILLGGGFTNIQPLNATATAVRNYIARLNADGTLDASFHPNANSTVAAIAVQSDGKIAIAGQFTTLEPDVDLTPVITVGTGTTLSTTTFPTGTITGRNTIARLNSDGTLDTTYNPDPNSTVIALALQSDGKLVIGGSFSALRPNGSTAIATRNRLARLNSDGTVDPAFDPNTNATVYALALQPDGKVVVGGAFTTLTPNGATDYTLRKYAARLNADGTVDATFNLDLNEVFNSRVDSVFVQPDGRILVGGNFVSLQPAGSASRVTRNHFARINANGTLDAAFVPGVGGQAGGQINALAVQADGKVVAVGAFADIGGATTTNIARFNPEGTPDLGFASTLGADGPINAVLARIDVAPAVPQGSGIAWINTDGSIHTAFSPNQDARIDGTIAAVAVQPDGHIIVGGIFGTPTGFPGSNLVRFGPDGTIDPAFGPSPNGGVTALVVQPDGKILVGGTFTSIGGLARNYIARLNADGSIDGGFDPNASARVSSVALQADGKIVIGGSFTTLQPNGVTTTTTTTTTTTPNVANSTATVNNADGTTTTTTISTVSGTTTTTVVTTNNAATTTRSYLARVNADGSLDTGFDPNANGGVDALLIQPDGKIVASGSFTTLTPNLLTSTTTTTTTPTVANSTKAVTNSNGTTTTTTVATVNGVTTTTVITTGALATARNFIARLNADGTVDSGYDPNANGEVTSLAFNPDGRVILGGAFTTLQPNGAILNVTRYYLARLNADGTVDDNFNPYPNSGVFAIAVQPDGRIVIGGGFTTLQPNGATIATPRNHLARVNFDGSLDKTFNPDANGGVSAVALLPDGSLVVGGAFTALSPYSVLMVGGAFNTIGGVASRNLALLGDDGATNGTFQPNPNGTVNALVLQPDGKTVVGGAFTSIAGATRNRLARFNADATFDTAFAASIGGTVNALALQPDGKILVGGLQSSGAGAPRTIFTRLNADGTSDGTFTPIVANLGVAPITAIAVQADGRILVVFAASATRSALLRFSATGSQEGAFNPNPDGLINGFALQTDGRLVVGGAFGNIGGAAVSRLARLNADGTADPTFNPAPDGTVTALALQTDGRLLIGGSFSSVGGLPRGGLARLAALTSASQSLAASRTNVLWARSGASPELSGVTFEQSVDAQQTWTKLGQAGRVSGTANWQLNGLALPASGIFYVRARGIVPVAAGTSSGVVESLREFNLTATPGVGPAGSPGTQNLVGLLVDGTTGLIVGQAAQDATSGSVASIDAPIGIVAQAAAVTTTAAGDGFSRLVNLSARARVTSASPLTAGFTISGSAPRSVLLRAIGPSLGVFGVTGVLPAPRLQLYDANSKLLAQNSGWASPASGVADLSAAMVRTGAFPLAASGNSDAAAVLTLAPGSYSMQVFDAGSTGGVALAEVYDAGDSSGSSRLVNLSIRGNVNAGDGAFISGIVITGNAPKRVLVRGIGPALAKFNVAGALADPILNVFDGQGQLLATNDNWSQTAAGGASANAATLVTVGTSVGAFPLDPGSKDAALTLALMPGAYSIQIVGAGGTTGAAMIEVYELP